MAAIITMDIKSPTEDYLALFDEPVGTVLRVDNFETVMRRIEENIPEGKTFELTSINPGTQLYTMYGCGHCIVTANVVVTT